MSAIILAGGKSTRMGRDKTRMLLSGKPMIDIVIDRLKESFKEVIVCGLGASSAGRDDVKYIEDKYKGIGPIAGIHSGLLASSEDMNFVMACDIPDIDLNIINYMESQTAGYDAVIPQIGGYYEPLFGFYNKSMVHVLDKLIEKGNFKIANSFEYINMRIITIEELTTVSPGFHGLHNINTPDDYLSYIYAKSEKTG